MIFCQCKTGEKSGSLPWNMVQRAHTAPRAIRGSHCIIMTYMNKPSGNQQTHQCLSDYSITSQRVYSMRNVSPHENTTLVCCRGWSDSTVEWCQYLMLRANEGQCSSSLSSRRTALADLRMQISYLFKWCCTVHSVPLQIFKFFAANCGLLACSIIRWLRLLAQRWAQSHSHFDQLASLSNCHLYPSLLQHTAWSDIVYRECSRKSKLIASGTGKVLFR